jgi:type IV pilus assembly protein PilC
MKLPIFGSLNKTTSVAVFARTFGSLLSSGVNILEAVDVVKASMDNQVYKDILTVMKEDIEKGNSLADSMKKYPEYFSPFEVRVLSIGERTGEVANGLLSIAEFYEKRTYDALSGLSTAIEPIILVFMGGVVVVVALSVITPIYGMLSGIQGI